MRRRRTVQRLLAVGGLAVAGWLLSGGGTAFADQVRPDDGARHQTGAPVHPAPVDGRSAKAAALKPSAELDVLAGRARRAGSHTAPHTRAASSTATEALRASTPESPLGTAPESSLGTAPESPLGALREASVVPGLPAAPAPYESGFPSLRPAAGAPGDVIAVVGARATAGDEVSAPAAGARASAPATTGEEAAGPIPPSAASAVGSGAERPTAMRQMAARPGGTQPGSPQPASPGSSGTARTGAAGETVPLGTARTGALPYGGRLLARATPVSRGAVPAMRTAADEPSFSPD